MTVSPREAIARHCKDCTYDPLDKGTWREQTEACTITTCDLYEHRPLTAKTKRLQQEIYLASLTHDQRELAEIRSAERAKRMTNLRATTRVSSQPTIN